MWAYRKVMKISWKEKKTIEEVLKMADEQLYMIPTIKKRKIAYFGKTMNKENRGRSSTQDTNCARNKNRSNEAIGRAKYLEVIWQL